MSEITVIIPIVVLDDSKKVELFTKAFESAKAGDNHIIVVGDEAALKSVEGLCEGAEIIKNDGDTCYASQVNLALDSVKTKYFSVLEYDDVYSSIWFNNVSKYIESDSDDTFAFLPLTEIVDFNTNTTIGYANEAVWASSFSDEIGCFDLQSIEDYLNFNTSGGVYKTSDFISLGKLKASMKLTFWYEFLLRALYKQKRVFVIPKVGYYHFVNRTDSITVEYANNMSVKEADFWIDIAKKEYFFPQDRKKTYEEE